jgi:hypothetical protein
LLEELEYLKIETRLIDEKFANSSLSRVRPTLLLNRSENAHGVGKESLSKTSRPGFVSTVRPDLPQPTHGLKEDDTLGGILFLRL